MTKTPVHLYMASLPDRTGILQQALYSLMNQVTTIQIALNYEAPEWLLKFKERRAQPVEIIYHDNSLQDGARFINAHVLHGYCLVADDDIEYPPDYVERLIFYHVMMRPEAKGFIAPMGKVLKPRPLKSYYKGWEKNFRTFDKVDKLERVDIPGCCGILWHTDVVKVNHTDMNIPNSDVCVGVLAKNRGIPCYVVPHEAGWLKNLMPEVPKNTLSIYGKYKNNDKIQTDYINLWM